MSAISSSPPDTFRLNQRDATHQKRTSITDLPSELIQEIIKELPPDSLSNFSKTCTVFRQNVVERKKVQQAINDGLKTKIKFLKTADDMIRKYSEENPNKVFQESIFNNIIDHCSSLNNDISRLREEYKIPATKKEKGEQEIGDLMQCKIAILNCNNKMGKKLNMENNNDPASKNFSEVRFNHCLQCDKDISSTQKEYGISLDGEEYNIPLSLQKEFDGIFLREPGQ